MSDLNLSVFNFLTQFGKTALATTLVFYLGYYKFSLAWLLLPILFSVWSNKRRKNREKRITYGLLKCDPALEKTLITILKSDDLPSWVHFPDFERAEWFNRIIKQLWPSINIYAEDLLRYNIEPMLQDMMSNLKLGTFKFEKVLLGDMPVRVGGVKVYETNISRKEIIMDLEIVYHGDCKILVSINRIKAGIKDLCMEGMLRVVMKPLIPKIPLIGGIQAYFLKTPSIDYLLTNAAEVVDIPGLGDVIRKLVVSSVASVCVLPNKYCMVLGEEGVLRVHVVQGQELPKKDVGFNAKSDPYCIINLGAQEFHTHVIQKTLNPIWDYMCEVVCEDSQQSVHLRVLDEDRSKPFNEDDYIGSCCVPVSELAEQGYSDTWLTLQEANCGRIHVRFQWLNISSEASDLKEVTEFNLNYSKRLKGSGFSEALLSDIGPRHEEPDAKVVMTCSGIKKETLIKYRTCDPIWEEAFIFFIKNVQQEDISFQVHDSRTNTKLGDVVYSIKQLLKEPNLEFEMTPILLLGSRGNSRLVVSMKLMILKPSPLAEKQLDPSMLGDITLNTSETTQMNSGGPSDSTLGSSIESEFSSMTSNKEYRIPAGENTNQQTHVLDPISLTEEIEKPIIESLIPKAESDISGKHKPERVDNALRRRNVNLPMEDEDEEPDPYIKLYLLPDRRESSKKKTRSFKDERNPVYDEQFEFEVSNADLAHRTLEVSACSKKKSIKFMSKTPVLGIAFISLEYMDLSQAVTNWYSFSSPDTGMG